MKIRSTRAFGDNWKKCIEQAVIDAKLDLAKAVQDAL
jgi:hypothetical protein